MNGTRSKQTELLASKIMGGNNHNSNIHSRSVLHVRGDQFYYRTPNQTFPMSVSPRFNPNYATPRKVEKLKTHGATICAICMIVASVYTIILILLGLL